MQINSCEKKTQKEINNKAKNNSALDIKNSFNSESEESELINRLLAKKLIKNSLIKNYNNSNNFDRNTNLSNKFVNSNDKKNSFGIKFHQKNTNNIDFSDNNEEILSEDVNSISEENYNDKCVNDNNLDLNEILDKSKEIQSINEFCKTKKFEYSIGDQSIFKNIKKEKRKLVLNDSLVSSDKSDNGIFDEKKNNILRLTFS